MPELSDYTAYDRDYLAALGLYMLKTDDARRLKAVLECDDFDEEVSAWLIREFKDLWDEQ